MTLVNGSPIMSLDPQLQYVRLAADGGAQVLEGGEAFWARAEEELDTLGRAWIVSEFECSADWSNWEMHPHADEFVYLLCGAADMLLEDTSGIRSVRLDRRGALVVPRGVWHTARVTAPSRMLFITRGAGTVHKPVDKRGA
jgi:mannose-6-phosphate isomerase-like protein (cupin superfamily)